MLEEQRQVGALKGSSEKLDDAIRRYRKGLKLSKAWFVGSREFAPKDYLAGDADLRWKECVLHPDGGRYESELNDLQLFAAIWSDRSDRSEAWILSTDRAYIGEGYTPGTLVEVESLLTPSIDPSQVLGRSAKLGTRSSFDPATDGLTIIEAQRRLPPQFGDGCCYIGGRAELVTVTRKGVTKRVLREWPDKVGEPIAA